LLPIPTLRWKDFPMSPLARFMSKNTRTLVPAWPLPCETACNSAALRRNPAVARGTPADSLRHISGTRRDNCGCKGERQRHKVQYYRYVMAQHRGVNRTILRNRHITRVQVALKRREGMAPDLKPIENTRLFATSNVSSSPSLKKGDLGGFIKTYKYPRQQPFPKGEVLRSFWMKTSYPWFA
jgi:hypothetical protein